MLAKLKLKKEWICLIVLVLLLIPQYFINLNGHNGWGGDFSQYIQQAINLVNNNPQSFQYYIFNPNYSDLAPPSYYPGFPLMLYPIVEKFGVDYLVLAYFMTTLLIVLAIVWYLFLIKTSKPILSVFAILLVFYAPFFLIFKNEVLADFPFTIAVVLSLLLFIRVEKAKGNLYIDTSLLVLVTCIAVLIKPLGLSLVIAYILYGFLLFLFKQANNKKVYISIVLVSVFAFLTYKYLTVFLLQTSSSHDSHFMDLFAWDNKKFTILTNLNYYYSKYFLVFDTYPYEFKFVNTILMQLISLSFLYGLYKSVIKKIDIIFVFFIIYLSIVLFFPFQQGTRYLIPIFIFLIHYTLVGLKKAPFSTIKKKYVLIIVVLLGYLLPLRIVIVDFAKSNNSYVASWGPLTKEAQECFDFIKSNTSTTDVIVFQKPRVLGLHTQRRSFANWHTFTDNELIVNDIDQFSPSYILKTLELKNPALDIYIENNSKLDVLFKNDKYTLYKINTIM